MLPDSCHCHVVPTAGRHVVPEVAVTDFDADADGLADGVAVCVTTGGGEIVGAGTPFVGRADGISDAAAVVPPVGCVERGVDWRAVEAADDEPAVPAATAVGSSASDPLDGRAVDTPEEPAEDGARRTPLLPGTDDCARLPGSADVEAAASGPASWPGWPTR
jgi:hypothetical protein